MSDIIKTEISLPPEITNENKFGVVDGLWDALDDDGKAMFNFLYEFVDRNSDAVFATDLFKLEGFTNQQIITIHKVLTAAKHNIAITAAQFVSGCFDYEEPANEE